VGFFIALSSPLLVGLIQEKVDPEYIGRVFSVFGLINTISLPLGMLVFGPLSDFYDISLIILLSGVGMVLIAIVPFFIKNLIKEGVRITTAK
jgi:DHA3 family macrolide efflux protein-like MFS transporter